MGTKISVVAQNNLPIWKRLWIYQAERFPLFGHGLMIMAFTFSAVSYSRIGREAEGFISLQDFMILVIHKSPLCCSKVTPEKPLGSNFQNPWTEPE